MTGTSAVDVVVMNSNTSIEVMAGDGAGAFTSVAGGIAAIFEGTTRSSHALADLDGDTDLDLIWGQAGTTPGLGVAFNNGTGTFGSTTVTAGQGVRGLAVGNLDGDADVDVVTTTTVDTVRTYLNNGAGVMTLHAEAFALGGTGPGKPVLADFNGGGVLDIVVPNTGGVSNSITVATGDGDGTFTAVAGSPFALGASPRGVAVANFNGAGGLDIAVARNEVPAQVHVMAGDGAGGFSTMAGSPFVVGGEGAAGLAAADFNLDGIQDLAVASPDTAPGLLVLAGNGSGGFANATGSPFSAGTDLLRVGAAAPEVVVTGDVTGDSKPDIVVPNNAAAAPGPNLRVLLNTFTPPAPPAPGGGGDPGPPPTTTTTTTTTLPRTPVVVRAGGEERYETAVEVNEDLPSGIDTAYVTTGENFPDALATGPVAGIEGAALLLVQRDAIPSSIADELNRLRPNRIVIVGGINAVSAQTQVALGAYADVVERIGGLDRYGTALELSQDAFASGASTAYLVSGEGFAEAVASGPAAGLEGGPILLVQGDSLAPDLADELRRLDPSQVVIAGGTDSISDGVESDVRTMFAASPGVRIVRAGGADRFDTGVVLAERVATDRTAALFVSTGEEFADGLAATPWAIRSEAPILLVPSDGELPASVRTFLRSHSSADVVVVGGTAAVSQSIFSEIAATRA